MWNMKNRISPPDTQDQRDSHFVKLHVLCLMKSFYRLINSWIFFSLMKTISRIMWFSPFVKKLSLGLFEWISWVSEPPVQRKVCDPAIKRRSAIWRELLLRFNFENGAGYELLFHTGYYSCYSYHMYHAFIIFFSILQPTACLVAMVSRGMQNLVLEVNTRECVVVWCFFQLSAFSVCRMCFDE